jgi:anti-anti-sigma regulatory factor
MEIAFSILKEQQAVAIQVAGRLGAEDVREMRRRTVETAEQTGFRNFIVDIRRLLSIEDGSVFGAYDPGEQFTESGFSV